MYSKYVILLKTKGTYIKKWYKIMQPRTRSCFNLFSIRIAYFLGTGIDEILNSCVLDLLLDIRCKFPDIAKKLISICNS